MTCDDDPFSPFFPPFSWLPLHFIIIHSYTKRIERITSVSDLLGFTLYYLREYAHQISMEKTVFYLLYTYFKRSFWGATR